MQTFRSARHGRPKGLHYDSFSRHEACLTTILLTRSEGLDGIDCSPPTDESSAFQTSTMSNLRGSASPPLRRLATSDDGSVPADPADARWTTLAAAVARAVRRQCPCWLSDQAQDIAQAALIKVMRSAKDFEGERPLTPFYLYRVAHSALVDEIRRRRRRREVALEIVSDTAEGPRSIEPRAQGDPEQDMSFGELGAAVRDCLVAMKRERRLAVMLHLQGHPVPEAARILGWNVKRTENLVYRGLADLRQCLACKGHRP